MEISLYISDEGKRIPLNTFLFNVNKLHKLLQEVESVISPNKQPILTWEISKLSASSAELALVGTHKGDLPYSGEDVIREVVDGLQTLTQTSTRPRYYSDKALQTAKELVPGIKAARVSVRTGDKVVDLNAHIIANVDSLLKPTSEALGTVEGALKTVSTAAKTWYFNIYDIVTGLPVRCNFDEDLLTEAGRAINRRVSVSGLISYGPEGYPKSIRKITELFVFPLDNELPSIEDVLNSNLDLAGGLSFEEFLEKRHND